MRIISKKLLKDFWKNHNASEQPLKAWHYEVKNARWKNHNELKQHFRNASVINTKRVVFNIKGNDYRLVAAIEYNLKIVFVVWIGTHSNYDKINVAKLKYVKTN
ncbi:MAG: type II toxin-antitoxin system HigB family toxin [Ignavibacteria bacterium]